MVGLTGGIGTGKSTVASLFAEHGVPVIDADVLARELVEPGRAAYEEIRAAFGSEILGAAGELDRRRLRELVFADEQRRRRLEEILHPRVYAEIEARLEALDDAYAVVVVPLLLETGGAELVDRVLVVDASREHQIQRTSRRDGATAAQVESIVAAQMERSARLEAADDVLSNDADEASLATRVAELHRRYLAESRRVARRRREMKQ